MRKKKPPLLKKCVTCGGKKFRTMQVEDEFKVGGASFVARLPAQECLSCHEKFIEGPSMVAAELQAAVVLSGHSPTPETFRFLRTVLRMKAGDLAELLDVAPETLSRWENGKREQINRASWLLLCSMVQDMAAGLETTRKRLIEALKTTPIPKRTKLEPMPA